MGFSEVAKSILDWFERAFSGNKKKKLHLKAVLYATFKDDVYGPRAMTPLVMSICKGLFHLYHIFIEMERDLLMSASASTANAKVLAHHALQLSDPKCLEICIASGLYQPPSRKTLKSYFKKELVKQERLCHASNQTEYLNCIRQQLSALDLKVTGWQENWDPVETGRQENIDIFAEIVLQILKLGNRLASLVTHILELELIYREQFS